MLIALTSKYDDHRPVIVNTDQIVVIEPEYDGVGSFIVTTAMLEGGKSRKVTVTAPFDILLAKLSVEAISS
jgi:hypothetical protein